MALPHALRGRQPPDEAAAELHAANVLRVERLVQRRVFGVGWHVRHAAGCAGFLDGLRAEVELELGQSRLFFCRRGSGGGVEFCLA